MSLKDSILTLLPTLETMRPAVIWPIDLASAWQVTHYRTKHRQRSKRLFGVFQYRRAFHKFVEHDIIHGSGDPSRQPVGIFSAKAKP